MTQIVVRVDKPAHGGTCVGRSDGRVVFCRGSLPGETVRARTDGEPDDRFWRAQTLGVAADPNPQRVVSPCPWFGPDLCGGCAWLHAAPELQVSMKAQVLSETLLRIGGLEWDVPVRSLGSATGWRTRLTLHVDAAGRAGFHGIRSNDVVPVGDCLQADPRLELPGLLQRQWLPAATVQVSVSEAGRAVVVRSGRRRETEGVSEHVYRVLGREFGCAVGGFWQSHRDAADALAREVRQLVEPGHAVLDLYAGVGLFGLTLADAGASSVVLVEGNRRAADYARRNADDDARVLSKDVKVWARRPSPAEVVVLDPPRAGAAGGGDAIATGAATL